MIAPIMLASAPSRGTPADPTAIDGFGVTMKNDQTQGVVSRAHVSLSLQGY